ncbi:MAG: efflux RND transporter permease subunit, partial [Proteobacteria bacterium]|nr:efflux RND transporter permease subunit [Pseudomonadota bacterium]
MASKLGNLKAMNTEDQTPNTDPEGDPGEKVKRRVLGFGQRTRAYFLAGILVTAPIFLTFYLAWLFIGFVDSKVTPLIPVKYNPETYLPFALPGLGLVILVLFVFLNFRTAFWVAMGIPLTLMGVFFLSPFFGVSIDMITLIAMIVVIGLIVDDAIIIAENISYRREMGDSPLEAAVNGTYGVLRPVFATIITTMLAFSPFFFMSGHMGKFMFSLPLIIVLALLVSFGEALTILPAHITAGKVRRAKSDSANRRNWFDAVRSRFQRFMVYVLRLRYLVVAVFMALLVGAFLYAGAYMQFILFPGDIADRFFVTVELETGTSLRATSDRVNEIERFLDVLPEDELDSYWTVLGSQTGGDVPPFAPGESENWALIVVTLTPYSERDRSAENIITDLRE